MTIDTLPHDVLLLIFHFDRVEYPDGFGDIDIDPEWRFSWWHRLVHVCHSWRSIVFASPNFLGLRLYCVPDIRMELIGIWPHLPIIIRNMVDQKSTPEDYDFDILNVHHDRVCEIYLFQITPSQLQLFAPAMQEQFPELIHLMLSYSIGPAPALPDGFLGGSAPRLQSLTPHSIPFPALPKLLSSAMQLVHLTLVKIPHIGYFPPESEAIVSCLSVLTRLEYLTIDFESHRSRPARESPRQHAPPSPLLLVLCSKG